MTRRTRPACRPPDVRTQAEQAAAYEAWRVTWLRWHRRGRRGPEPEFYPRESYEVTYDTPDADGYWGRRLAMMFYARADDACAERSMHDQVRARFGQVMGTTPFVIYDVSH